jgi:predicted small lipoprotein YifL
MLRQFRTVATALALLAIAGCGIKGPLVLPPTATPPATAAPPDATTTAPAADPATSKTAPAERKP